MLKEPEEIHTYKWWEEHGYIVRKGQHSIVKLRIWKCRKTGKKEADNTDDDKEAEETMFLTTAHFFSASQVERIQTSE